MATVAVQGGAVGAPALLLVGNARASGVGARREALEGAAHALRVAGARVEPHLTESLGELGALIETAEGRRLAVLGGDGSLHALANLEGPQPEIALLPAGAANNIATSLGIPTDLRTAARLAVEGKARSIDGIDAGGFTALEGVSVGFLARARARYRGENSADLREGLRAGFAELRSFRPVDVVLVTDGEPEALTVSQLFVANMPRYAFGLRVAPGADPADGLLDLVVIGSRSRAGIVRELGRLRRGRLVPPVRRAERVTLRSHDSPVVADSTNLGTGLVALTVKPRALRVVAP